MKKGRHNFNQGVGDFCSQVLRLYATFQVMTDLKFLNLRALAWLFALSLSISAWSAVVTGLTATFRFFSPAFIQAGWSV